MGTQKYFKLLNKEENHNGFQFKTGLNINPLSFNLHKGKECVSGGIYFSKSQDILKWLNIDYKSFWIREVIIPEDTRVIKNCNKFKADKIILNESMILSELNTWEYLVEHNVDIHVDNDYPLCWAAGNGYLEVTKYLVEREADIHTCSDFAFRWAAINGHLEVVDCLLKHGADIYADDGYTLCWSAERGHLEVVRYLVKHGADIYADRDHAIYLATKNHHDDVVNYLKSE